MNTLCKSTLLTAAVNLLASAAIAQVGLNTDAADNSLAGTFSDPGTSSLYQFDSAATNTVRGVIKPADTAIISSETQGRVIDIPFAAGERFNRGDLLMAFDCELARSELEVAEADLRATQRTYQNAQELLRLNAAGYLEVDIAEAEYQKSAAVVEIREVQVDRCRILAPYDGAVVTRLVNSHESVSVDQDLLEIVGTGIADVELIVPSSWLVWLKVGYELDFYVDEIGESHDAIVDRISAVVDPISQTVTVYCRLRDDSGRVLPGMSGSTTMTN